MNYEDELKKKYEEIQSIREEQLNERLKTFPNLVGKNYRVSTDTIKKIRVITKVNGDTNCQVQVFSVSVNSQKNYADISTCYFTDEIHTDRLDEVTDEVFNEHLKKAIDVINKVNSKNTSTCSLSTYKGLKPEEKKERFQEIGRQVAGLSCADIDLLITELGRKKKRAVISPYHSGLYEKQ